MSTLATSFKLVPFLSKTFTPFPCTPPSISSIWPAGDVKIGALPSSYLALAGIIAAGAKGVLDQASLAMKNLGFLFLEIQL